MNNPHSPANLNDSIAAARSEGPSAGAASRIWSGVAGSVAPIASAGAGTGAGAGGGGMAVAKAIAGTLFGGTVTVGLAATVLYLGASGHAAGQMGARVAASSAMLETFSVNTNATSSVPFQVAPGGTGALTVVSPVLPSTAATSSPAIESRSPSALVGSRPAHAAGAVVPQDTLALEATLVGKARAALERGDARSALATIRATHALTIRQMRPEELSVEGQALRALGLDNDADAVELSLKVRYPESALAR